MALERYLYTSPDGEIVKGEWSDDALSHTFLEAMG